MTAITSERCFGVSPLPLARKFLVRIKSIRRVTLQVRLATVEATVRGRVRSATQEERRCDGGHTREPEGVAIGEPIVEAMYNSESDDDDDVDDVCSREREDASIEPKIAATRPQSPAVCYSSTS